jgi:hypothetical protein
VSNGNPIDDPEVLANLDADLAEPIDFWQALHWAIIALGTNVEMLEEDLVQVAQAGIADEWTRRAQQIRFVQLESLAHLSGFVEFAEESGQLS